MGPTLESILTPQHPSSVDSRVVFTSLTAVAIRLAAAIFAQNLTSFDRPHNQSFILRPPEAAIRFREPGVASGLLVIFVPIASGVIIGLMARYGSEGTRGDEIPEVMEQVLRSQSRIKPGAPFFKPLSAVHGRLRSKNFLREVSELKVLDGLSLSRLPVVRCENPLKVVTMPSASDVGSAKRYYQGAMDQPEQTIRWRRRLR